jgi:hypothetical protein
MSLYSRAVRSTRSVLRRSEARHGTRPLWPSDLGLGLVPLARFAGERRRDDVGGRGASPPPGASSGLARSLLVRRGAAMAGPSRGRTALPPLRVEGGAFDTGGGGARAALVVLGPGACAGIALRRWSPMRETAVAKAGDGRRQGRNDRVRQWKTRRCERGVSGAWSWRSVAGRECRSYPREGP